MSHLTKTGSRRFSSVVITPPAPTITTPTNNGSITGATLPVGWAVTDQTSYRIRIMNDAAGVPGTTVLYDTGDVPDVPTRSRNIALDPVIFPNGRVVHVQVSIKASTGPTSSAYASVKNTVAYSTTNPTITSPPNNGNIPIGTLTVSWTVATQTDYEVRLMSDVNGSPSPTDVLYTTGVTTDSAIRTVDISLDPAVFTEGRYVHTQVRTKNAGTFSPYISVRGQVNYPGEENWIVKLGEDGQPCLPFNVPPPEVLEACTNKVLPHGFAPHHIEMNLSTSATKGLGTTYQSGAPDWYDKFWLADYQPKLQPLKSAILANTGNADVQAYDQYGGAARNRPKREDPPVVPTGSTARVQNRLKQLQWCKNDGGYDGFYVEVTQDDWLADGSREFFDAWDRSGWTRSNFILIPMVDTSLSLSKRSPDQMAAIIYKYTQRAGCYRVTDRTGTRFKIAVYQPEGADVVDATTGAVKAVVRDATYWKTVRNLLQNKDVNGNAISPAPYANGGVIIDYHMCGQRRNPYDTSTTAGLAYDFREIAEIVGTWQTRDVVDAQDADLTTVTGRNRRGQAVANSQVAYTDADCAKVHPDLTAAQRKMQSLGVLAPGDERAANGNHWHENGLTQTWEETWLTIIGDWQTGPIKYQPNWVQIPTWNDYYENALIEPNRNFGYNLLDMGWWWLIKYKLGVYPKIRRNAVYLTHRIEFRGDDTLTNTTAKVRTVTSTPYAAPVAGSSSNLPYLIGRTQPRDEVEARVWATGPCKLQVKVGTPQKTAVFDIPAAGMYRFTVPMLASKARDIQAVLLDSTTLAELPRTKVISPWAVSRTRNVPDASVRGGSSLRPSVSGGVPTAAGWDAPQEYTVDASVTPWNFVPPQPSSVTAGPHDTTNRALPLWAA